MKLNKEKFILFNFINGQFLLYFDKLFLKIGPHNRFDPQQYIRFLFFTNLPQSTFINYIKIIFQLIINDMFTTFSQNCTNTKTAPTIIIQL